MKIFESKLVKVGIIAGLIAGVFWLLNSNNEPVLQGNIVSQECPIVLPAWTSRYQQPNTQVLISTAEKQLTGMHVLVSNQKGEIVNKGQEPSWRIGGTLGNFTFDSASNIYIVPTPIITQQNNPKNERQSIFKVDTKTGIMEKWLDIPIPDEIKNVEEKAYLNNVYGNIGITSDCKSNKLYVSSVTGSDKDNSRGQINEIDINTKSIKNIAKNIDGFGMLRIDDAQKNQYLFYGDIRSTSMGLIDLGSGKIKKDIIQYENPNAIRWDSKIKKMRLKGDVLELSAYPFDYTLATSSDNLITKINYKYSGGKWELQR